MKFLSCPECNCVKDDEERTIKAQIEMDPQLEKKWIGTLTPQHYASKHKTVNFSCGKLQIITSIVCKIMKRIL